VVEFTVLDEFIAFEFIEFVEPAAFMVPEALPEAEPLKKLCVVLELGFDAEFWLLKPLALPVGLIVEGVVVALPVDGVLNELPADDEPNELPEALEPLAAEPLPNWFVDGAEVDGAVCDELPTFEPAPDVAPLVPADPPDPPAPPPDCACSVRAAANNADVPQANNLLRIFMCAFL
jgi:hypothetical protein